MSKLLSVKADGSLKISVESQLLQTIRKAHAWYTSKTFATWALLGLALIDIMGFLQITNLTLKQSLPNQIVVVAAFAVAFEGAPLYIGYALCLKSYKLGKAIHNWVLWLSFAACVLGVIVNIIFRALTMEIAYLDLTTNQTSDLALPMTILMCVLPVITSLINLVIGCLSFDPLLFDLLHLSKKLRILKLRKRQLEACLEELSDEDSLKEALIEDEEQCYNNAKIEIVAMRIRLRNYINAKATLINTE